MLPGNVRTGLLGEGWVVVLTRTFLCVGSLGEEMVLGDHRRSTWILVRKLFYFGFKVTVPRCTRLGTEEGPGSHNRFLWSTGQFR